MDHNLILKASFYLIKQNVWCLKADVSARWLDATLWSDVMLSGFLVTYVYIYIYILFIIIIFLNYNTTLNFTLKL